MPYGPAAAAPVFGPGDLLARCLDGMSGLDPAAAAAANGRLAGGFAA
jgi:hypothetical protein